MELRVYISTSADSYNLNDYLDIDEKQSVQLTIADNNPLKIEQKARNYSSSIKCPANDRNDRLLAGFRYPAIDRQQLFARISVGGVFLDAVFSVSVSFAKDTYSVNLVEQKLSVDLSAKIVEPNSMTGLYGEIETLIVNGQISQCINIAKLVVGYLTASGISSTMNDLGDYLCPELVKLELADAVDAPIHFWQYSETGFYVESTNSDVQTFLDCPDMNRTISTSGSLYVRSDDTSLENQTAVLDFGSLVSYRVTGRLLPSGNKVQFTFNFTSFPVRRGEKAKATIKMLDGSAINPIEMLITEKITEISGTDDITSSVNYGDMTIGDMIDLYCKINLLGKIQTSELIATYPMLTDAIGDLSQYIQSIESIAYSDAAAKKLTVKIGDDSVTANMDDAIFTNTAESYSAKTPSGGGLPCYVKTYNFRNLSDYQTTVYPNVLQSYINNFTTGIEATASATIPILAVKSLSTTARYYVRQLGGYYYMESITGYNLRTGECKLKLLKIN